MTDDLSANTLVAVRKSMTVMSFMIIVYYFAGGHIPNGEIAIKLPLSNVTFEQPERLMYALWLVMAWWVYRYFSLGAYSAFEESFRDEWVKSPQKLTSVRKLISPPINSMKAKGYDGRHIVLSRSRSSIDDINHGPIGVYFVTNSNIVTNDSPINSELTVWRIRLVVATSYPTTVTFVLPLILIVVAATLTII